MHVTHLIYGLALGGLEQMVIQLASRTRARGIGASLLALGPDGPIGEMAAGPKRKLEGIDALVQQEAADRVDEEKLAKRLMICSNCLPARSNDEATGRSTR